MYEHTVTISLDFQMGHKPLCPDSKKGKKSPRTPKRSSKPNIFETESHIV